MEQKEDWHLTDILSYHQGRGDPFAAAIRGTRMPMIITNPNLPDNPIVFANESFQKLTGYDLDELLGRNCRFLQGPDTNKDDVSKLRHAIEIGEPINVDLFNYRKDGSTFWNALYVSPVRDDNGNIQFFFASQLDVTDRVEAQNIIRRQKEIVEAEVLARTQDLQLALEAKTILLHEVDHRVKNNLTMIGALLRIQARSVADLEMKATLENMLSRVDALATVHRKLYQSDNVEDFDIGSLAETLIHDVIAASGRRDITVTTSLDHVDIPANKASAVALILNELLTNSIKHAFVDRPGSISLTLKQIDGSICINISDDGPGFNVQAPHKDSMGRTLVERLSKQLRANTVWDMSAGTNVAITFSNAEVA